MAVSVGVRELRQNLTRWLGRVAAGETVVVTRRGKPVARVSPPESRDRLAELIAAGRARAPSKPKRLPPMRRERMSPGKALSDFVIEQRR